MSEDPREVSIPLPRGYVTVVSEQDADLAVGSWNAFVPTHGKTVYATRYRKLEDGPGPRIILLHRVIAERMGFNLVAFQPDHIDRNGLNNRRDNLREATRTEQVRNRSLQSSNTSGFVGVTWNNIGNKWQANIRLAGKKTHLGLFTNVFEAAAAYDRAALCQDPEYCRLNFDRRCYDGTYATSVSAQGVPRSRLLDETKSELQCSRVASQNSELIEFACESLDAIGWAHSESNGGRRIKSAVCNDEKACDSE